MPILLRTLTRASHLSHFKRMDVNIPSKIHIDSHLQYHTPESLVPASVDPSPLAQFKRWFQETQGTVLEPEAMTLSTATKFGVPSSRMVLLKEVDDRGFVFFTNYESRKSGELGDNPVAALTFYWRELHRQVRVIGQVEKVAEEESAAYFKTRPLGSRLGAWASPQSQAVEEGELGTRYEDIRVRFGIVSDSDNGDVPKPPHWGGWRVIPL
jgi:pyridoxamine-phosphate oxidase